MYYARRGRPRSLTIERLVALVGHEKAREIVRIHGDHRVPSMDDLLHFERKLRVIQDFLKGDPPGLIAMRYQVRESQVFRWAKQWEDQVKHAEALAKLLNDVDERNLVDRVDL